MRTKALNKQDAKSAANYLRDWAAYLESLSSSAIFAVTSDGIQCTVQLPTGDQFAVDGPDAFEAIKNLIIELPGKMGAPPVADTIDQKSAVPTRTSPPSKHGAEEIMRHQEETLHKSSLTKSRQETIGVTSKKSLHATVINLAVQRNESVAVVARELVLEGFRSLEKEMLTISPTKLLETYEKKARDYDGDATEQWMVRIDKKLAIKLKLTAKEYEKSASQVVAACLSNALVPHYAMVPHSAAAELTAALATLALIKGPQVTPLAAKVGLGKQRSLLSRILSGGVEAPGIILDRLATALGHSRSALQGAMRDNFSNRSIPAFKAENGKPQIESTPMQWEAAVKELALPSTEEAQLLSLKD
ncbi:hypothetical protein [Pseudomonas sp. NFPP24]|uniref:hypothetical protein n=1 Tax=Pseudomonas sp. NFPP24 TaxID=1566228 RepID=UPI000A449873|nr:hypothetical protein [Pseudomonas sp. NFPP24]